MVIRIFKYFLLALLVAFSQTILSNLTSILGIAPNYGTIIILVIILWREYPLAYPAAFMVGIIIDALNPEFFGYGAAVRFAIAIAAYEIRQHLDVEQLPAQIYLLIGSEISFQLLYQSVVNSLDMGVLPKILLEVSLPTLVYTTVVGAAVLLVTSLQFRIEVSRRSTIG